jgi:hypothetical protein
MTTQEEEVLAALTGTHVTGLPVSADHHSLMVTRMSPYDALYPPDQSGGWYLVQVVTSFTQNRSTFTSHTGETRTEWTLEPVIIAIWAKRKA